MKNLLQSPRDDIIYIEKNGEWKEKMIPWYPTIYDIMKKAKLIPVIILSILMTGCGERNKQSTDTLITVDVTAHYPEKELILQEFLDVEYVPLETNDEFITQGHILAVGNQYILVKNSIDDGDIFIFDRKTGKGLRKINRKGQGGEEYNFISGIALDEDNSEIFVNSTGKKILVYDLSGNFKRSLAYPEDTSYSDMFNYDNDNLICYNASGIYRRKGEDRDGQSYHLVISKQDGSITRNIHVPFEIFKSPMMREGDAIIATRISPIVPYHDNWLLVEISSDTVHNWLSEENTLTPFLVKTPTTDPEIFLTMGTITDRYCFMKTTKMEVDLSKGRGFPSTDLLYDKQENTIFNATVLNGDYLKKQELNMTSFPINDKIAAFQTLAASEIVDAYENEELKGKLKEIAANLDEEDNPVIMLMKYKK